MSQGPNIMDWSSDNYCRDNPDKKVVDPIDSVCWINKDGSKFGRIAINYDLDKFLQGWGKEVVKA